MQVQILEATHTKVIDIDSDVKRLAVAVLKGDSSALNPMMDCHMEQTNNTNRITPDYVNALEDCIRDIRRDLRTAVARGDDPYDYDCKLYNTEVNYIEAEIFKLERWARTLGRQGLS